LNKWQSLPLHMTDCWKVKAAHSEESLKQVCVPGNYRYKGKSCIMKFDG